MLVDEDHQNRKNPNINIYTFIEFLKIINSKCLPV